jgi:hypothetical protein
MPYIEHDVLIWKPTVTIVNWGMNDGRRKNGVEYYKAGIVPYVDRLLAAGCRVVLCSNTPIDVGDPPGTYTGFNKHFVEMTEFARNLAAGRGIPFVDQFNFCHPLWGENRKREKPVAVTDQTLAPHPSDYVHARAPGQLMMAHIILKTLGAPAEVSYAAIDVAAGTFETRRCAIRDLQIGNDTRTVRFVRADEASPCWIDDLAATAFVLAPFQQELNRMSLIVKGLPEGRYTLDVAGVRHGEYAAAALAGGINLSENRESPVSEPGREAAERIAHKYYLTRRTRDIWFFKPPEWLTVPDLAKRQQEEFEKQLPAIRAGDEAAREAATPKPLAYEITRVEP